MSSVSSASENNLTGIVPSIPDGLRDFKVGYNMLHGNLSAFEGHITNILFVNIFISIFADFYSQ